MNCLLILIAVLLIGNAIWGYKKGFLRTAFSLVSWIAVFAVCYCLTPAATDFVMEKTNAAGIVQEEVLRRLYAAVDAGSYAQIEAAIPEAFRQTLLENAGSLMQEAAVDLQLYANKIVYAVFYGIISIVIVLIAKLAVFAVDKVLGIASKLPLIGSVDTILGAVLGAGKGFIWCWLVLAVIAVLTMTGTNTEYILLVQESPILIWLYEHNILLTLFSIGKAA